MDRINNNNKKSNMEPMEKEKLTLGVLKLQYGLWLKYNNEGRNIMDIRFGQYLHINYKVDHLFPIGVDGIPLESDGFMYEKATDVYELFLKKLS